MTEEQDRLIMQARESLAAAVLLHEAGHHGFAASRAYYVMFCVAEALLLGEELSFSRHAAVQAAFGKHFVKTGLVAPSYHRAFIRAMTVRHAGDYGASGDVTPEEAIEQIARAQDFLSLADRLLGPE